MPGGVVSAGKQALRLRVLLAQGAASDDELADPGDVVELHHDPRHPSQSVPSRAYFRKASGRRLDIWVWIAKPP